MGHYCPVGSANGIVCPTGTFLNVTGGEAESDCYNCTRGMYCDGTGNVVPDGECWDGYYCPEGQNQAQPPAYICPQGKLCMCVLLTSLRVYIPLFYPFKTTRA